MSVQFKDYYGVLGVSRSASAEEIKKSFRKLARQYHPDVAKNTKGAEDRFKEINEAYEVLGDPEKRKKYDQLGASWRQGEDFRPPPGWEGAKGFSGDGFQFEVGGTGFSDFFEQIFGGAGGFRGQPGFRTENYSEAGQNLEADLMVTLEEAMKGAVRPVSLKRGVICPECGGTGVKNQRVCEACGGQGQQSKVSKYQVKIPAGVSEGQRLRVAGQGEAGSRGGKAGDLFLRVRFAKHPDFRVENGNLYYECDLAPWEAVLGTNVSIPTLQGRVNIKIPPGTQDGQQLRVRGRGLARGEGTPGDLFVVARIALPTQITEEEQKLWTQLAQTSNFRPRN